MALTVLLVMILTSCDAEDARTRSHDEKAARTLQSAAAATLGSESFIAETKVSGSPQFAQELTRTYTAPDRLRLVSSVSGESILIGGTTYHPLPNRPGYYEAYADGERITVEDLFPHLAQVLRANEVNSTGSSFTFELPSGRGEAEVVDGRIVALTVHEGIEGEEITADYTFSMFDEAPPVEAPPEDRVTRHEPLPPCDQPSPIEAGDVPVGAICDPEA